VVRDSSITSILTSNTSDTEPTPPKQATAKPILGISSCLLGEPVRYDGGHRHAPLIIQKLAPYFSFRSFCPEMAIGLGVPRNTIQLVEINQQVRCIGVKNPELDVTDKLTQCAQEQQWHQEICGYVAKARSPSCGKEDVKVRGNSSEKPVDTGLYTAALTTNYPHLPIANEEQLNDPGQMRAFIKDALNYALRRPGPK